MSTFCAVNDDTLISLIESGQRRIVLIAPGIYLTVAQALCRRFREIGTLEVTVVLDPDEDVCRIGFGEIAALQEVHKQAQTSGFFVRAQPGLRVGVLLVDDHTLVWSPTPRAVEPAPASVSGPYHPAKASPNGLLLGSDAGEQIAHAVCAEGTDTDMQQAEIGVVAVTPFQVQEVVSALARNPPIPVDLARVTRVFSTKLQFVELKVARAKLSQQEIRIPSSLLNADANEQLRTLLDAKLRAFADFKDRQIEVPMFVLGEQVFDKNGKELREAVSEGSLNRERNAIEADFLYDVAGFGRLMERARRTEFEKRVHTYKTRLTAHADGLRKTLAHEAEGIIKETVHLVGERMARAAYQNGVPELDREKLTEELYKALSRAEAESPAVKLVFKEVTYDQTQDEDFRKKLNSALPPAVKRRLGDWYEKFSAAKGADNVTKNGKP